MSLVYNEYYNNSTGLTVGINKLLFSEQSPYQLVEVYDTDTWGNLLTIDGMVMLSEKDEFVYHEMLIHVPLFTHPNPENVLIIGGGDGGSAREALKHKDVNKVDMVEIDETVVRASKRFLPNVGDFNNPRLNVIFDDGISFVKNAHDKYDVIIIDGSDPVGPAEGLFRKQFFEYCYNALTDNGVLATQTESPWVKSYHNSINQVAKGLRETFAISKFYLAFIPLYPTGMWSMAYAGKNIDPHSDEVKQRVEAGYGKMKNNLRYYNADIHTGAFAIPNFMKEILK
ncbi:MAG TPA: polyamine aminopropyltransferase [Balneolales bacterium]|nr:polyamine aminopropyltransferase [Balneolales bacterium]